MWLSTINSQRLPQVFCNFYGTDRYDCYVPTLTLPQFKAEVVTFLETEKIRSKLLWQYSLGWSQQSLSVKISTYNAPARLGIDLSHSYSQLYANPALNDSKRVVVDVRAVQRVPQPVTLVHIKQDGK